MSQPNPPACNCVPGTLEISPPPADDPAITVPPHVGVPPGAGMPLLHAPTHQHGGADEVATEIPAANAIPKAGNDNKLNVEWLSEASHIAKGIVNLVDQYLGAGVKRVDGLAFGDPVEVDLSGQTVSDYWPAGLSNSGELYVRTDTADATINSILAQTTGRLLLIANHGPCNLTIKHAFGIAANQVFYDSNGTDLILRKGSYGILVYYPVSASHANGHWHVLTVKRNNLLDGAAHADTTAGVVMRGDIIRGNSTPAWERLALGAINQVLTSNGTDAAWSALTAAMLGLTTKGDLLTYTTALARLGVGANGHVLTADNTQAAGIKWAAGGGLGINSLVADDLALEDEIPFYDLTDAANQKTTVRKIAGFINPCICELRLSLVPGNAFPTTNAIGAGTIYCTPIINNGNITTGYGKIALYDGARWRLYHTQQLSANLAASPGVGEVGGTANTNYDVWIYDNAGILTLEATAWASNTTRLTPLADQDGVLVKSGAPTQRYLGTYRVTGTANQTEDSLTNDTGGSRTCKRFLWNHYHRRKMKIRAYDQNASWNYTSGWRKARDSAVNRIEVVVGQPDSLLYLMCCGMAENTNAGVNVYVGIDEDGEVNSDDSDMFLPVETPAAGYLIQCFALMQKYVGYGYHYYQWMEGSSAFGTTTWLGLASGTLSYSGLLGWIEG